MTCLKIVRYIIFILIALATILSYTFVSILYSLAPYSLTSIIVAFIIIAISELIAVRLTDV